MGDGKKRTVAMKRMNKEHVYAKRQVDYINNERRLLGSATIRSSLSLCVLPGLDVHLSVP